jgi:hypothetical protein
MGSAGSRFPLLRAQARRGSSRAASTARSMGGRMSLRARTLRSTTWPRTAAHRRAPGHPRRTPRSQTTQGRCRQAACGTEKRRLRSARGRGAPRECPRGVHPADENLRFAWHAGTCPPSLNGWDATTGRNSGQDSHGADQDSYQVTSVRLTGERHRAGAGPTDQRQGTRPVTRLRLSPALAPGTIPV